MTASTALRASLTHYSQSNIQTMDAAIRKYKCNHGHHMLIPCPYLNCHSELIKLNSNPNDSRFVYVNREENQPLPTTPQTSKLEKLAAFVRRLEGGDYY